MSTFQLKVKDDCFIFQYLLDTPLKQICLTPSTRRSKTTGRLLLTPDSQTRTRPATVSRTTWVRIRINISGSHLSYICFPRTSRTLGHSWSIKNECLVSATVWGTDDRYSYCLTFSCALCHREVGRLAVWWEVHWYNCSCNSLACVDTHATLLA